MRFCCPTCPLAPTCADVASATWATVPDLIEGVEL